MGSVSTIKLRQHACTVGLLERPESTRHSIPTDIDRKIHRVDTQNRQRNGNVLGLTGEFCTSAAAQTRTNKSTKLTFSASFTNMLTISVVQPSTNKHPATIIEPAIMNGLRRPHFDRDRSAMTPISGCMISPDRGPAIQTSDVRDLVRPSWSRYGVQSASGRIR